MGTESHPMSRLEPIACPFCGHVGLEFDEGSTLRWLAYSCAGCGIGSETRVQTLGDKPHDDRMWEARDRAVAEWNRRTPAQVAMLEGAEAPSDLARAYAAACAFIDSHVGDPDMTDEMVATYAEFCRLRRALSAPPQAAAQAPSIPDERLDELLDTVTGDAHDALYEIANNKKVMAFGRLVAQAAAQAEPKDTVCSTHPDAPHGFNRDASHSEDRYVCDCEGWVPAQAEPAQPEAPTVEQAIEDLTISLARSTGVSLAYVEGHIREAIGKMARGLPLREPSPPADTPAEAQGADTRACTCAPEDKPPTPCPKRYALNECRAAEAQGEREALAVQVRHADERGDEAMRRAHEAEAKLEEARKALLVSLQALDVARDAIQPLTRTQIKLHRVNPKTDVILDEAAEVIRAILAANERTKP